MVALTVKEVKEYGKFSLVGENVNIDLVLEFFDVNKPKVGDKILMHERLLNRNSSIFTQPYSFKRTLDYEAEEIKYMEDMEYAVLKVGKDYISLKRVYG